MSNRQARRQQSRQARRQASTQRGRSSGAPRQGGGGGGRGSNFLSWPYLIGVGLLAAVLFGIVIFFALRDGGDGDGGNGAGGNADEVALNAARADLASIPRDGNVLGAADAPVTLVQYEDFQCPSCLRYTVDYEPFLIEEYVKPGLLRLELRHFPVVGTESTTAARGAVCAGAQDRFWEFANRLFAIQAGDGFRPDQGFFDEPALTDLAGDLGLDEDAFAACLADPDTLSTVSRNDAAARAIGFRGTPSFTLNGNPLQGAPGTEDTWRTLIDTALADAGVEVDADDDTSASAMGDAEAAGNAASADGDDAGGATPAATAPPADEADDDAGAEAAGEADESEAEQARRREAARANVAALDAALDALAGIPQDGNALGAADAPVTLVQYADFQCPSCLGHAVDIEPFLIEEYVRPGLLRIELRHLPVVGAESTTAARGAVCAAAQDRSWEYANRLFALQAGDGFRPDRGAFGEPALTALAGELGLDENAFAACLADPDTLGAVEADQAAARESGFQGTPSFVLDDAPLLSRPGTEDGWRALIDAALVDDGG